MEIAHISVLGTQSGKPWCPLACSRNRRRGTELGAWWVGDGSRISLSEAPVC